MINLFYKIYQLLKTYTPMYSHLLKRRLPAYENIKFYRIDIYDEPREKYPIFTSQLREFQQSIFGVTGYILRPGVVHTPRLRII